MKGLKAYLRELGRGVFTFFLATLLTYGLLLFSPGGKQALSYDPQEGSNWASGYLTWLGRLILNQDWGNTRLGGGQSVLEQIALKGVNSFIMIAVALLISGLCAVGFRYLIRRIEHISVLSSLVAAFPYALSALPAFIVGSYLIQHYPQLIYIETKPLWLFYLTPGVILGITDGFLSEVMRYSQDQIERIKAEGYMLLARAKGARTWEHLRYELGLNLAQLVFSKITVLVSGTVVLEYMFKLPGIGSLVFGAAEYRDINLLLGCLLALTFVIIVFNFFNKILWVTIDPRLR